MTSNDLETVNFIRGRNFISKFFFFLITDEKTGAVSFSSITTKFAAVVASYLIVEFSVKIHYGKIIDPSWIQFLMTLLTVSGLWHLGRRVIQNLGNNSSIIVENQEASPIQSPLTKPPQVNDVSEGGN